MSAKLICPIPEAWPSVQVPQDAPTTRGQSRAEQEHHTSVMLLEAVACLRELSEIVLRHDRILTAKNSLGLAAVTAESAQRPATFLQPDDAGEKLEPAKFSVCSGDQAGPRIDAVKDKKSPWAGLSLLLSAAASVSGLALTYALFLR
jgi:hypothetical protein